MADDELTPFDDVLVVIEKLSEAASDLEVVMPAIIITARMVIVSRMDDTAPDYDAKKRLLDTFEKALLGAWILKHSQTTVGEGIGIVMLGLSPWSSQIGEVVTDAVEEFKKAFKNNNEQQDQDFESFITGGGFRPVPK